MTTSRTPRGSAISRASRRQRASRAPSAPHLKRALQSPGCTHFRKSPAISWLTSTSSSAPGVNVTRSRPRPAGRKLAIPAAQAKNWRLRRKTCLPETSADLAQRLVDDEALAFTRRDERQLVLRRKPGDPLERHDHERRPAPGEDPRAALLLFSASSSASVASLPPKCLTKAEVLVHRLREASIFNRLEEVVDRVPLERLDDVRVVGGREDHGAGRAHLVEDPEREPVAQPDVGEDQVRLGHPPEPFDRAPHRRGATRTTSALASQRRSARSRTATAGGSYSKMARRRVIGRGGAGDRP